MRVRALLIGGFTVAATGVAMAIASWFDVFGWQQFGNAGVALLIVSLLALTAAVFLRLQEMRHDLMVIRDRSKSTATNIKRLADRIEEIRTELFLGSYSHVPGQVARIEAGLKLPSDQWTRGRGHGSSPNEVFDRVYVLNLAHDTEKMTATASLLESFDIEFVRFPAVDGWSTVFDDEWNAYLRQGPVLPKEAHLGERLLESRGALGYLETMCQVLTEAQSHGLESILVLEDDIRLHREFADLFATAWSELPDTWSVVYLGSVQSLEGRKTRFSEHLYHPGAVANGSYALAIHASAFGPLITSAKRHDWPFDAGALREVDVAYPGAVFAISPPLVIADVGTSSIRPGRDLTAHAGKHGWDLDDYTRT